MELVQRGEGQGCPARILDLAPDIYHDSTGRERNTMLEENLKLQASG